MYSISQQSDAKYFDESNAKSKDIHRQQNSNDIKDKWEAMKRQMALICMGYDMSIFFADVVKCICVQNYEVKKYICMYLTIYSQSNQDLAQLSMNSFQQDLQNESPIIRGNAIRSMVNIRVQNLVPQIIPLQQNCIYDAIPYVRISVAISLASLWRLDKSRRDIYIDILELLFKDINPYVLSATLYTYSCICNTYDDDAITLLDKHLPKILYQLADFHQFGQIVALRILTVYARKRLPSQAISTNTIIEDTKSLSLMHYKQLLQVSISLQNSMNSGVIINILHLIYSLSIKKDDLKNIILSLLHLYEATITNISIKYNIQINIENILRIYPDLGYIYIHIFFLYPYDQLCIKILKLRILKQLINDTNAIICYNELQEYIYWDDKEIICESLNLLHIPCNIVPSQKIDLQKQLIKILRNWYRTCTNIKLKSINTSEIIIITRIIVLQREQQQEKNEINIDEILIKEMLYLLCEFIRSKSSFLSQNTSIKYHLQDIYDTSQNNDNNEQMQSLNTLQSIFCNFTNSIKIPMLSTILNIENGQQQLQQKQQQLPQQNTDNEYKNITINELQYQSQYPTAIGTAKSTIVWILSKYIYMQPNTVYNILQKLQEQFSYECDQLKEQIQYLSYNQLKYREDEIKIFKQFEYTLNLCYNDPSIELRDIARYIHWCGLNKNITRNNSLKSILKNIYYEKVTNLLSYSLGTQSLVVKTKVPGYMPQPEWNILSLHEQDTIFLKYKKVSNSTIEALDNSNSDSSDIDSDGSDNDIKDTKNKENDTDFFIQNNKESIDPLQIQQSPLLNDNINSIQSKREQRLVSDSPLENRSTVQVDDEDLLDEGNVSREADYEFQALFSK